MVSFRSSATFVLSEAPECLTEANASFINWAGKPRWWYKSSSYPIGGKIKPTVTNKGNFSPWLATWALSVIQPEQDITGTNKTERHASAAAWQAWPRMDEWMLCTSKFSFFPMTNSLLSCASAATMDVIHWKTLQKVTEESVKCCRNYSSTFIRMFVCLVFFFFLSYQLRRSCRCLVCIQHKQQHRSVHPSASHGKRSWVLELFGPVKKQMLNQHSQDTQNQISDSLKSPCASLAGVYILDPWLQLWV